MAETKGKSQVPAEERLDELLALGEATIRKVITENVGRHEAGAWTRKPAREHAEHAYEHAKMAFYALEPPPIDIIPRTVREELEHAAVRSLMALWCYLEETK